MNIETKNMLFVVSLISLVLLGVASTSVFLVYRLVQTDTDQALLKAHKLFTLNQRQVFSNLGMTATNLSKNPVIRSALLSDDKMTLQQLMQNNLETTSLDIVVLYAGSSGDVAVSRKAEFSGVNVKGSPVISGIVDRARKSKRLVLGHAQIYDVLLQVIAIPVHLPAGRKNAVLLLGQELDENTITGIRDLVGTEITLFKSGEVLSNSKPGMSAVVAMIGSNQADQGLLSFNVGEKKYYGRVFPIMEGVGDRVSARLLFSLPVELQWAPYYEIFNDAGYAAVLILLLAALSGIYVSRSWLAKPIKSLVKVSSAIGGGDLTVSARHVHRSDELGELARAFNQMREQLLHAKNEEEVSNARFEDFAESSSDWLWETNENGVFTFISNSVSNTLGYAVDELVGKNMVDMFGETMSRLKELHEQDVVHEPVKDMEVWLTSRDGIRLCLRLNAAPWFQEKAFKGYRGSSRDITKSKTDEERLIRLANRDHLSGLANRRRFIEDIRREIQLADRNNTTGAIALIDLDHFKLVNDTAGHAAGDEVIIQVAALLRRMARKVDLVARLSGDEFAIAFVNTSYEQVKDRVTEILKELSQLKPTYSGKILNTSASIGIVLYPEHGDNPMDLLARADTAMYGAKREGRNRLHLYSDEDHDQSMMGSQLIWKERIHDALENDRFVLAFQPIAPTTGEKVARYEVLIRMKSADGSLHTPGSFIPVAEQFSMIHHIDRWVVRNAIRTLASLDGNLSHLSFSINLSGLSVGDESMMKIIETELLQTNLDRNRVIFEVTESAAFQDINRAIGFISRIKQMGCRIALDDFGVGFSSFSYLKQLQADVLKIDGSFIRDIQNSREDQLFVKALVDVARGMGIMTVAEFVENEETLQMIRTLGVDYAQGYHIGKPTLDVFNESSLGKV